MSTPDLNKTLVSSSAAETAAKLLANPEAAKLKEETNILPATGKVTFAHAIPMSSFVFPNGKTINFRGGIFSTSDDAQIKILRDTAGINPLISELNESGEPVFSAEDKMKEQASRLLD